jgi:hypothetical protein
MVKNKHKKHVIGLQQKCKHENIEFQFDTRNCRTIEGYLILTNPITMYGTCECGEYIEEVAVGGLFKLPEKVSEKSKKKKSGLKFGYVDDGLEFDE